MNSMYTISCKPWTLTHPATRSHATHDSTVHCFLQHMDSQTLPCNTLTLTPSLATHGLSNKTTLQSNTLCHVDVLVNIWTPYSITCNTEELTSSLTYRQLTSSRTLLKDSLSHFKTACKCMYLPIQRILKTGFTVSGHYFPMPLILYGHKWITLCNIYLANRPLILDNSTQQSTGSSLFPCNSSQKTSRIPHN